MNAKSLSYFSTEQLGPSAYLPTLTYWLGHFLSQAEQILGPRDRKFTILGVQIISNTNRVPHTWFSPTGENHVLVNLSKTALNSELQARWQLAHECIHLIDPWIPSLDGGPTNMLEEGLATWFQNIQVTTQFREVHGSYAIAEELVSKLMKEYPYAIREIREHDGTRIGEITEDRLMEYCPTVDKDIITKLTARFA